MREVPRPLHKSFRILLQSLQHIRQIALEMSGEIQFSGGRQPSFLRAQVKDCAGCTPSSASSFPRGAPKRVADYGVDVYFAAFLKASLCTIPYARPGGFSGTTVILPLAYTVKHEQVVRLEGHALYPEDMAFSRDMYLLQLCSGLDDNAAGGCAQFVFAPIDKTCAVDAPLLPSGFCVTPLDPKSLQDMPSANRALDLASTLEVGSDGAHPHGEADLSN